MQIVFNTAVLPSFVSKVTGLAAQLQAVMKKKHGKHA